MTSTPPPANFDAPTWTQIESFLTQLPARVELVVWADAPGSDKETATVSLVETLVEAFDQLSWRLEPRAPDYPYYPLIGVMGFDDDDVFDPGIRLIGWPRGYQIMSLVGAIQAVAFRGMTLEPVTRIRLHQVDSPFVLQLLTAAEDESGPNVANLISNVAVVAPSIRSFVIMVDDFPEAARRYAARLLPRLIINENDHIDGATDEAGLLKALGRSGRGPSAD